MPKKKLPLQLSYTRCLFCYLDFITCDKVIIFEPAYDSYAPSVLVNKGEPIYIRLRSPNLKFPRDKLEQTLRTQEIRLILFNNPHNPA